MKLQRIIVLTFFTIIGTNKRDLELKEITRPIQETHMKMTNEMQKEEEQWIKLIKNLQIYFDTINEDKESIQLQEASKFLFEEEITKQIPQEEINIQIIKIIQRINRFICYCDDDFMEIDINIIKNTIKVLKKFIYTFQENGVNICCFPVEEMQFNDFKYNKAIYQDLMFELLFMIVCCVEFTYSTHMYNKNKDVEKFGINYYSLLSKHPIHDPIKSLTLKILSNGIQITNTTIFPLKISHLDDIKKCEEYLPPQYLEKRDYIKDEIEMPETFFELQARFSNFTQIEKVKGLNFNYNLANAFYPNYVSHLNLKIVSMPNDKTLNTLVDRIFNSTEKLIISFLHKYYNESTDNAILEAFIYVMSKTSVTPNIRIQIFKQFSILLQILMKIEFLPEYFYIFEYYIFDVYNKKIEKIDRNKYINRQSLIPNNEYRNFVANKIKNILNNNFEFAQLLLIIEQVWEFLHINFNKLTLFQYIQSMESIFDYLETFIEQINDTVSILATTSKKSQQAMQAFKISVFMLNMVEKIIAENNQITMVIIIYANILNICINTVLQHHDIFATLKKIFTILLKCEPHRINKIEIDIYIYENIYQKTHLNAVKILTSYYIKGRLNYKQYNLLYEIKYNNKLSLISVIDYNNQLKNTDTSNEEKVIEKKLPKIFKNLNNEKTKSKEICLDFIEEKNLKQEVIEEEPIEIQDNFFSIAGEDETNFNNLILSEEKKEESKEKISTSQKYKSELFPIL